MGALTVLIMIVSVLLVLVVLIQNSKGGGIASNFASNTQVVGVKKQAEIIEKITWGLVSALIVLCIASAAFNGPTTVENNKEDSVLKNAELPAPVQQSPLPNNNIPVNPTGDPNSPPPTGGTGTK